MDYIEQRDGGYYVRGVRVSLDSIVYCFREGASAETIQQSFPSLSLEQVYGAITFYLANRSVVDENIRQGEAEIRRLCPPLSETNPELYDRLMKARDQLASSRS